MGYDKIESLQIQRDDNKKKEPINTDKIAEDYAQEIRSGIQRLVLIERKKEKEKKGDGNELQYVDVGNLIHDDLIMFDKYEKNTLPSQEFEEYKTKTEEEMRKEIGDVDMRKMVVEQRLDSEGCGLNNSRESFLAYLQNRIMATTTLKESRLQRNFKKEIKKYQPKQPQLKP